MESHKKELFIIFHKFIIPQKTWQSIQDVIHDIQSIIRFLVTQYSTCFTIQTYFVFLNLQEWQITTLSFEEDPEPFGKERDAAITALAQEAGVETVVRTSHTLYNLKK